MEQHRFTEAHRLHRIVTGVVLLPGPVHSGPSVKDETGDGATGPILEQPRGTSIWAF